MSDSSESSPRMHLSQFYDVLVEVRAAVDVLFDTLAYMEAGDDEQRYQAFKEALHERHQHAKAEHLETISDLLSHDMPGGDGAVGEGEGETADRTPPRTPADED